MGYMVVTVALGISLMAIATSLASDYKVVCYHTNWSRYRTSPATFKISDIDPFLCTHLIYAFGVFDSDGFLTPHEGSSEYPRFQDFNNLKLQNPNLKTLIAIGGWNFGGTAFSTMANDITKRGNFVSSTVSMLRSYGFDGLDIDWEYPAQRGGQHYDKTNLVILCQELINAFNADAVGSGKSRLLLTAAVPAGRNAVELGYDVPELNKYLDFFNLMTYDFHGGWNEKTGHNSPLYASSHDTGDDIYLNTYDTAAYWHQAGVPKDKVIVGLPTYGRTFTLTNPSVYGLGAAASTGPAGIYTRESGFNSYYEICNVIANDVDKTGRVVFDDEMKTPYFVNNGVWIGYDNVKSLEIKAKMIADNNYGGMMIWSLALDDFNYICPTTTQKFPLIKAAINILNPGSSQPPAPTGGSTSSPSGNNPTTTTISTPTEQPIGFSCVGKSTGNYKDPESCSTFYVCDNNMAYLYDCADGLYFDETTNACNWPDRVNCDEALFKK